MSVGEREEESLTIALYRANEWLVKALADGGVPLWRVFVAYARNQVAVPEGDSRRNLYAARAL